MLNKIIVIAACFLLTTPFANAKEKMTLNADSDGQVSYEEYRASKEKTHERQFQKMDSNGDGYIDAAEKKVQKDKMRTMREKRKQNTQ